MWMKKKLMILGIGRITFAAQQFEKKLSLALQLTADLPDNQETDRWLVELIKFFVVLTHLFVTNKKGFLVLSRSYQVLICQFLR
jgi:protein arginine N-methyltransferase 5